MLLTPEAFQDLLRLLDQHPEWQGELRRRLLTDALLQLPALVGQLVAAQTRTEGRMETLAEAQARTQQHVEALAAQVGTLAQAQACTETLTEAMADAQTRTTAALEVMIQKVDQLTSQVGALVDRVGDHEGQLLELEYIRKAAGRFGRIARRVRVLDPGVLVNRLDDAMDDGRLTFEEWNALLNTDFVAEGRRSEDQAEVYLLVEVSSAIDIRDLERARDRSSALAKLGRPVVPVAAGRSIHLEADQAARGWGIWRVLNGRAISPDEPAW